MKKSKVYTLKELEEMNKAFNSRMDSTKREIEADEAKLAEVHAAMDAATATGDIGTYKKLYMECNDLELNVAALTSIVEQAEKTTARGFTDEDVMKSWAEYIEAHNANIEAYNREFEQAKAELVARYLKAAKEQNTALKAMREYGNYLACVRTYAGKPLGLHGMNFITDRHQMFRISNTLSTADDKFLEYVCDLKSEIDYDYIQSRFGK